MKEEEDFCPILKRVRKDTMQLAKRMTEIEGRTNGGGADSRRISGVVSPAAEAVDPGEERDALALLRPKGYRPQTLEDMFDLTKGRFPCDRK